MKNIAEKLQQLIDEYKPLLLGLSEQELSLKHSPGKWSKKEIIGHLADSAQNNIRRFVLSQYEDTPFIIYNQDEWVKISNYQQWNSSELTELWYLLNKQICAILSNATAEAAQRNCQTQELHSLEWLAHDYIKHLKHHLHQVLQLEPVPYP